MQSASVFPAAVRILLPAIPHLLIDLVHAGSRQPADNPDRNRRQIVVGREFCNHQHPRNAQCAAGCPYNNGDPFLLEAYGLSEKKDFTKMLEKNTC